MIREIIMSILVFWQWLIVPSPLPGQNEFTEIARVKTDAHLMISDALGNIYLAKDYQLEKYSPDGTLLFTYNNYLAGRIFSVDPADPFKVLVYYRDFGQVDILDNTLTPSADPVLLRAFGLELP